MDAGFVPALPFHHGYLEPDCVERRGGGAYARDKNTSARLCAKNAGGAYARGWGVFAGHHGNSAEVLSYSAAVWTLVAQVILLAHHWDRS